jgi:translation elongation factor EF-1alpha
MYRCGNKIEIGDCVTIKVNILVEQMRVQDGAVAIVLNLSNTWSGSANNALLTLKLHDSIQQIPASWCTLCQRK